MPAPKCVAPKRKNSEEGESRCYKYPDEHECSFDKSQSLRTAARRLSSRHALRRRTSAARIAQERQPRRHGRLK